jgi:hypothetical protein
MTDFALRHAREAVAQYEERVGKNPALAAKIRDGQCDGFERVQCARAAVEAAAGWQPIESAPKTGEILLWNGALFIGEWEDGKGWRTTETSAWYSEPIWLDPRDQTEAPTHWKPRPEQPE